MGHRGQGCRGFRVCGRTGQFGTPPEGYQRCRGHGGQRAIGVGVRSGWRALPCGPWPLLVGAKQASWQWGVCAWASDSLVTPGQQGWDNNVNTNVPLSGGTRGQGQHPRAPAKHQERVCHALSQAQTNRRLGAVWCSYRPEGVGGRLSGWCSWDCCVCSGSELRVRWTIFSRPLGNRLAKLAAPRSVSHLTDRPVLGSSPR